MSGMLIFSWCLRAFQIEIMQIRKRAFGLIFIVICNILIPFRSFGQDSLTLIWKNESKPADIRIKAINEYYKSQTYAKPEDVLQLTFLHEKLASDTNNQQEIAQALNERSFAYFVMGDVKNSMQALKQGIAVLETLNDEGNLVAFYVNLASLLSNEGQYKDAIDYYHKSLDVFRKAGKWENEALTLNNIGIQLINLEGYDLALNHFEEALDIYKSKGKMDGVGYLLAGMSQVYFNQGKVDLAINAAQESVILLEKDNNQRTKADVCFVLAEACLQKGDKNKARLYLDESLQLSRDLNNHSLMFDRLIFDATLSLDDDIKVATEKAENLLGQLNEEISPATKSELYELLYNCYKVQGKYDKSLEMYEKHKTFSDSAATQKVKLEVMRQVIQKDYEDKLLKNEVENKHNQSSLRGKLIGILVISTLLILVLFFYGKSKITLEKQKREALLSEIDTLKKQKDQVIGIDTHAALIKEKLENVIGKKLNETDWNVLNILLDDPVISNADLADKAFMSVDGIGSSLRRMYEYFDIPSSKYMKIVLLLKAIKISSNGNA